MATPLPPKWATDSLSKYLDSAHGNNIACYLRMPEWFRKLSDLDSVFEVVLDPASRPSIELLAPLLFLSPSHQAYRAAARLGMSGQLAPAHMVARGCIEQALYAHHFFLHREDFEPWMSRHDDEVSLKRVKREFKPSQMIGELEIEDSFNGKAARLLYDRTIDAGAHPNVRGMFSSLRLSSDKSSNVISHEHFTVDNDWHTDCLKRILCVGVCSLKIFQRIFPEKFDILGVSDQIARMSEGL